VPRAIPQSEITGSLSDVIDDARRGEVVTVTAPDGEPIARIGPAVDADVIRMPKGTPGYRLGLGERKLKLPGKPVSEIILEDRER